MNKFRETCSFGCENSSNFGLLALRTLPAYFLVSNHGWSKITNPEKWNWLGTTFAKYFFGILDFATPAFGFIAAFSESICAILVLLGLFTRPAALLVAATMLIAAFHHITTTGNPESALVYFSVFIAIAFTGPGKFSLDSILFASKK
ncbi:MAG: DoxX family protein [Candidatus Marinimicrobia bacterium]|jgi:putative oxidoreductase|nr:DoxX family protein [Candidatus Neomarinimicrobiota bacterium]MBT3618375.1 DoxX family protein [Candidatus Neomarinimicrobiota bacterium]MBT3829170.1 DoxX family protein [Candidatus Neomarinimicrobiota bacterium]MBT3998138.1 DoxX family protein [Candidatus Neomarinimicrobiota bacterium]MBT4281479.1 DoxX family protein [Candidatus Neomarinimicrobiota bacterium]